MFLRRFLGPIRRVIYNTYDNLLYKQWQVRIPKEDVLLSFEFMPKISIVVPTYNTDISFFDVLIDSVKEQTYTNWELVFVDDKSPDETIRKRIIYYAKQDERIIYRFLGENQHIAGATNEGVKISTGEFIGLLDHDDVLKKNALYEVVKALNINNRLDFIYTDEDKIVGKRHIQPFLKPGSNRELLHSVNYITHFSVIRRKVLMQLGGENGEYNGAQDWELFLRVLRTIPAQNVYHIPKILYSWRIHELSTSKDMGAKPYVIEAQKKAIEQDIQNTSEDTYSVSLNQRYPGQWKVTYLGDPGASIGIVSDAGAISDELTKASKYIAIVKGNVTPAVEKSIECLVSEAARSDVGVIVTGGDRVVRRNLVSLLGRDRAAFVSSLSQISISKHIYRTTRYTLPEIMDYDIAVVESSKVDTDVSDIRSLGNRLSKKGLHSLFIPYQDTIL